MKRIQFLALIILISLCSISAHAQADPFNAAGDTAAGARPFGSYDGSNFDFVDLATGGLNLKLDVASLSARGHKSTYGLRYSSKFWSASETSGPTGAITTWSIENTSLGVSNNPGILPTYPGWRDTRSRLTYLNSQAVCPVNGNPQTYTIKTNFVYVDENGAKHSFPNWKWVSGLPPSQCQLTTDGYYTGYASDGGMVLSTAGTGGIVFPSGNTTAGAVEDTQWSVSTAAPTFRDPNGNQWSGLTAANGQTYVQLGLDGTSKLSTIQVLDASGQWQTWSITPTTVTVSSSPKGSVTLTLPGQLNLPSAINRSYTFAYGGSWGELTKVTLPTGGYIRYEYTTYANGGTTGNTGLTVDGRYVTARIVSPDGNPASEQRTAYSYVINTSNHTVQTTVTRPDGSYEVHYFDTTWGNPTKELWVEWHSSSGALLKRVDNTWTCDTAPITSFSDASSFFEFQLPFPGEANCRITNVLKTLDDGQQSQVSTTYDSFTYTADDNESVTETHGNIKEVDETAYGTSGPGSVVRVTKYKYQYEMDSSYGTPTVNIVDRVAAKWVGTPTNTLALTETQYDTTAPSGIHGNPSVTKSALLQSGAPNGSDPPDSSVISWQTTTSSFDTYGNRTSMVTPQGHTNTYEYNECNYGYLSATNYAVDALSGYREEKTWNCDIGEPATSSDLNAQSTSFGYNDALGRLTNVTRPDSSYVSLAYDDTNRIVTATELVNNGAASTLVGHHAFDGLGRLTQSNLVGDTCGPIKTDTTYDSVGRIASVSNPYCSQSESTYGITSYQYDGLDRKTLVIPADGTISSNNSSTVYSGNCATVTDEAGKQRRSCKDALGRVVEVDEPNGTYSPAAAGSGSIAISGTEQSTQSTTPGTPGTGTVTISGHEQSGTFSFPTGDCVPHVRCYDDGTVSVTINGQTVYTGYGQGSTTSSVAAGLATAVNNSSSYATASVSGSVVTLTARTSGVSTNYSLSVATVWDSDFPGASFTPTRSGATLTGGTNSTTNTVYDSGTVSVTVSGTTATVNYSQSMNSTATAIAGALASAINGNSNFAVTASSAGTTINLTAKQTGASTNYAVSTSSTTSQGSYFASPSFSGTNTTLSGGQDASGGLSTPLVTQYAYDVLDNLTCVVQKGTDASSFTGCASAPAGWRPRSATYDSLSRLVSATNPESGTITYQYDSHGSCPTPNAFSGLLVSKTDARGVRTCFEYDALNRVTQKSYSTSEPAVGYSYDGTNCLGLSSCYNKGRRTGMTDAAGSEAWAYDQMGRNTKEQRTTNSVTKTTSYSYYVDGSIHSVTYPSGRTISYGYDAVTRPTSAVDSTGPINYVTNATYNPAGSVASLQNGSSVISQFYYNSRMQPCRISVRNTASGPTQCSDTGNIGNILDFSYSYNAGAANNGDVNQIANNRNTDRTQNFTYDALNRIATASTQATSGTYAWGLQFGYDNWGNLLSSSITQGSAPMLGISVDSNNRVSGYCYDASGNLLAESPSPCPTPTYTHDAENRLKTVNGVTYTYDGDGNRVEKSNGKLYWYGAGSEILDESDGSGSITNEYVYFGGKRLARRVVSSGQVQYYFADQIGTARVVTDASGNILDDSDFYPFGGERSYASSSGNSYKFSGKERDTESGLDNFGARYFTSQYGRFMTPDWSASPVLVPYADLGNPQTFNQYSYVANNPLNSVDPEGHFRQNNGSNAANYHDTDSGQPMYGDATTAEQAQKQAPPTSSGQAQNQSADPVQQVTQAMADAKQKAIAEANRAPTDADRANALIQAGKEADVGVKAAMVVTAPNYIAMGVIVATDAGAVEVGKNVVQGVKNVNEELVKPAGQRVGAELETRVPGGVKAATDFTRGVLSPRNAPSSPAGVAGAVTRVVVEKLIKTLFP